MPAQGLIRHDGEGIYSHIYNRGAENRTIFNDQEDYEVFLGFLRDYLTAPQDPESTKKTFQVHGRTFRGIPHQPRNYFNKAELVAYNLAPDHFHLVLHQLTQGSIEKLIRSLCTRYSIYFNKKYHHTGALFAGPYKSVTVEIGLRLSHLSRYLHSTGGDYSSYPEYLGSRKTPWVKPEIILNLFDNPELTYKDFVESDQPDQNLLLDKTTLENKSAHLERRGLASNVKNYPARTRIPEFLTASTLVFLLLVALGLRNVNISNAKSYESLPSPEVLAEAEEVKPEEIPETEPETEAVQVTIKSEDGSLKINIRQEPTTSSQKIGQANNGDSFEFVSKDSGWYEIKLADGSTGFISAKYVASEGEQSR